MKKVTETARITYKMFDRGELVKAVSPRCPLIMGRAYKVEKCIPPAGPQEPSIVFVKGSKYGIDTEYVEPLELTDHKKVQNMSRLKPPKNVRRVLRKTCGDCYYFRTLKEVEPAIESIKGCLRPQSDVRWEQGDLDIFAEQFYTVCDRFRFN